MQGTETGNCNYPHLSQVRFSAVQTVVNSSEIETEGERVDSSEMAVGGR